jgi:glycerol-3-phosphate acyltransferase PlsY
MMPDPENYLWAYIAACAVIGYLIGSVSFARIVTYFKTKSSEVKKVSRLVPGSEYVIDSELISATTVNVNLGKTWGLFTSFLDMTKVGLPSWLILHFIPEYPFYLIVSIAGIAGHNYPLYHHFKGGRGQSPLLGAMFAINWPSVFISVAASMIAGYLTGAVLVAAWSWMLFAIIWFAVYFHDIWHIAFIILANGLFWYSTKPEIKKYLDFRKTIRKPTQEEVSDFVFMSKGFGRFIDDYSLPALIRKLFKRK